MIIIPEGAKVLELGTLRLPDRLSHHKHLQLDANWTLTDIENGPDVDVTADAHDLKPFTDSSFDFVVAYSVFEHLARPWLAAKAIARVLRHGGQFYVETHQSFPIHGYPSDYFRFSREALTLIFEDAGLTVTQSDYRYPAQLIPPPEITIWDPSAPVFLNVWVQGEKS